MNRARALVIRHECGKLRSIGWDRRVTTENEQRLATEAIEWLQSKRDEPKQAAVKRKGKGR